MNLVDNKVLLYFAYPEQIVDPGLLDQYRSLLTNDELAQADRFFAPRHRHQYLITRALIRTSLSAHFPVGPADWRFEKNKFGKPEICYPDKTLSVRARKNRDVFRCCADSSWSQSQLNPTAPENYPQRRCIQSHCSGYSRTQSSIMLVTSSVVPLTSISPSLSRGSTSSSVISRRKRPSGKRMVRAP
jgi:hypothetical protein